MKHYKSFISEDTADEFCDMIETLFPLASVCVVHDGCSHVVSVEGVSWCVLTRLEETAIRANNRKITNGGKTYLGIN